MTNRDPSDDRLDRLLGGSPDLGVSEQEAILDEVLAKTAGAPARRWVRWLVPLAAVTAALLVVLLVRSRSPEEWTARGGSLAPSVELSCLVEGRAAPCERGAKLVFTLTPRGASAFAAIAEAPDGETIWLVPGGRDATSAELSSLSAGGVLDRAAVLDGPRGHYTVHAVFSKRPLTRDELRAALLDPSSATDLQVVHLPLEVR